MPQQADSMQADGPVAVEARGRFAFVRLRGLIEALRRRAFRETAAVPERYRAETRATQLAETLKVVGYSAVTHVAVAVSFLILFWSTPQHDYVLFLFVAVTVPSAAGILAARAWKRSERFSASTDLGLGLAAMFSIGIGAAWGTMPIALFLPSDSDHRMLVVATTAGLVADVYALGPSLLVCMSYVVPLLIGAFIGINLSGQAIGLMLSLLLAVYSLFVVASSKVLNNLSVQRIVDRVRVSEQNDTIGLLLRDFEQTASDWLWETDAAGCLVHVSERVAEASGQRAERLDGMAFAELLGSGDLLTPLSSGAISVLAAIAARKPFQDQVAEVAAARFWRLTGKPMYDKAGSFCGYRGVGTDATAAHAAEAKIAFMANHDALTGLTNRAVFMTEAEARCEAVALSGGICALFYCDLDGFKRVNDTHGHPVGDELLRQVSRRLEALSMPGATICRLGGDEFAILCGVPKASVDATVHAIARDLIDAVSAPYDVFGSRVAIGISVGIALTPDDATIPDALLVRADLALYRAKIEGRGAYRRFTKAYETSVKERRAIESDLRTALAQGEFELLYQPLVDFSDGSILCFEALIRWHSPRRGTVSPGVFIPIAESMGLITAISQWVLMRACRAAAAWPGDVGIAINISPPHLKRPDFVHDVLVALEVSGLEPERLELEITEGVFLDDSATAIENLHALRRRGIRVALDDFGTGFSSLNYLINFPVDKIKIDQTFIADLVDRQENRAIVSAIVALAKDLGIRTTAEGVETTAQLEALQARCCDEIQGYLISPPLPLRQATDLLDKTRSRARATCKRSDRVTALAVGM